MSAKALIRKDVLSRRDALTHDLKKTKDEAIKEKLLDLPGFKTARCILFYASFKSEVNTFSLMYYCLEQGKRVAAPKVNAVTIDLSLYEIKNMGDLIPGHMGIPEPAALPERRMEIREMDLIIVPGVAFDEDCNRLGYGKGFYDKLLSAKRAPAVALCYEEQIVASIPAETHDIKMDIIITDKRIIHCNGQ